MYFNKDSRPVMNYVFSRSTLVSWTDLLRKPEATSNLAMLTSLVREWISQELNPVLLNTLVVLESTAPSNM